MKRRDFIRSAGAFFAALAGAGPKLLEDRWFHSVTPVEGEPFRAVRFIEISLVDSLLEPVLVTLPKSALHGAQLLIESEGDHVKMQAHDGPGGIEWRMIGSDSAAS